MSAHDAARHAHPRQATIGGVLTASVRRAVVIAAAAGSLMISGCTVRYFFPGPSTDPLPLSPGTWASSDGWGFTLTLREDGTGYVTRLPLANGDFYPSCVFTHELNDTGKVHRVDAAVTWDVPEDDPSHLNVTVQTLEGDEWLWMTSDGFSTEHWGRLWYFPCDPDNELIPLDKLD
jgi:hypothetical protein